MQRLAGKVVIVTGGARGIGEAIVRLFVENGAKVVIGDILDEEGLALANDLGDSAVFQHLDVSCQTDWDKAVVAASDFGELNVLVNNAGILLLATTSGTTEEQFTQCFRINQLGTFLGMRSVLEPMKAAGGGSIVNMSSVDGLQSKNGLLAYSGTKWAVRGMTKAAAIEMGKYGIRVNSVHPGGVFTEMGGAGLISEEDINEMIYGNFPLPRVGKPAEIASMALFVASDEASYSTGSEFIADGGRNAGFVDPSSPQL